MIRPYIGAGIGWSWAKFGDDVGNESYDALAWQGLAGINLEIIPRLSLDIGYRYFMSKYDVDYSPDAEATMADHMIYAGLNFHFGGSAPVPPPPPPEPEPEPEPVKKCPDTPSCCVVDSEGCPIDSDKDGVCDGCDKCPDTPPCCVVDLNGCPVDSDEDGICDGCDRCLGTPKGVAVDKDGCPLPVAVVPEIIEKGRTTLNVLFDFDKATIKQGYFGDIDKLADVLKDYPDLNVVIEGHTDNIGTAEYNKKLSQRRADAVKKYLVEKAGIDAKRLTAVGYGLTRPIVSNATREGRQTNRRVEAVADYIIKKK
jgi:OOP family OmpA-OmpF porin